ncbi:UDP-glucuronic acid decarboxylase family protein [uncultured Litoreibacter sp.]|uniref:UDP-glucuronic acid decarboxylase family protein n=1 Tax=uncultured Litoreibacter sp. TaxID=1392394 RepID=UPI00345C4713
MTRGKRFQKTGGLGGHLRILVTGSAGFLGSHLCDRLLQKGHTVVGLDNFLTGRAENLAGAFAHPAFEFVDQDVVSPFDGQFDQIYHLASPASPPMYQRNPVETAKINFIGTLNAMELAKRTGARILLTSTSEVYGDPEVHPQPESYSGNVNQTGPRACYDEGKRIAETLAFDYHRQHQVDIRVVRIFNTYGPRMHTDDGRVVSQFVADALAGRDITVFGNGGQTRSFCYYADLVAGLDKMMNTDGLTGPVNLGNPEEISINEFAELVVELAGSSSRIVTRPLPIDDPKKRRPDISKAKRLLDWAPTVSLREGLIETIELQSFLLTQTQSGTRGNS